MISLFFPSRFDLVFFFGPKQTKQKQTCAAALTLSMATTTTAMPADINAPDNKGRTKIFLAAEVGDTAEVARLLELKADFELPSMTDAFKYLSPFKR